MKEQDLDKWFTSISVKQKEHIAAKILLHDGKDVHQAAYPNSWNVWKNIGLERKETIHAHCTDAHGMWAVPEKETTSLGHDF